MIKIYPKRRWGQNFLKDRNIARKIVSSIDTPQPRFILEIGPGKGMLTEFLIPMAERYLGVEIDPDLSRMLVERFAHQPGFKLIQGDLLLLDLPHILETYAALNTVVIGNIPFNITSPILFKLFEEADSLQEAILMVQKEVGERMKAHPHSKDYGLLSIYCQLFAGVSYLFTVPSRLFSPQPRVDSAVLRLKFKKGVRKDFLDYSVFQKVLRHCFQHRRKMLRKSLSMLFSEALIRKLEVDLTQRPEQLAIADWKSLVNKIILLQDEDYRYDPGGV